MKILLASKLLLISASLLMADGEPYPDALSLAIQHLQKSEISELRSHLTDEDSGYFLKDASLLGRVKTSKGDSYLFRFTFIRTTTLDSTNTIPARGHTFVVLFDGTLKALAYRKADMPEDIKLSKSLLTVGDMSFDLSTSDGYTHFVGSRKAEQGAAANP